MKKTLILILTLLVTLSLITGCGKKDSAPASAVTDLLDNLKSSSASELEEQLLGSYSEDSDEYALFKSFDLSLLYKNLDYEIVSSVIDNPNSDSKNGTVKVNVTNTDFSVLMSEWAEETILSVATLPEDISIEEFNTYLFEKSGEILAKLLSRSDNKISTKAFVVEVYEDADGVWKIKSGIDPNKVLIGLDDFSEALAMS